MASSSPRIINLDEGWHGEIKVRTTCFFLEVQLHTRGGSQGVCAPATWGVCTRQRSRGATAREARARAGRLCACWEAALSSILPRPNSWRVRAVRWRKLQGQSKPFLWPPPLTSAPNLYYCGWELLDMVLQAKALDRLEEILNKGLDKKVRRRGGLLEMGRNVSII